MPTPQLSDDFRLRWLARYSDDPQVRVGAEKQLKGLIFASLGKADDAA